MWTRAELKEKAKRRIKPNYWRTVLVSLIVALIGGGIGAGSSVSSSLSSAMNNGSSNEYNYSGQDHYGDYHNGGSFEQEFEESFGHFQDSGIISAETAVGVAIVAIVGIFIFLIIFAIAMLIQIFLLNPLTIGCKRYFVTNLSVDADIKEVCYTYDKGYKNGVKVMFFRDLYVFLWSLLLIVPGIVKSYEYRMIPYLLGENPDMDKETAFAISRQMMTGNKWNAFVLDLSFIGWYLLSGLTCGILSVFYVNPYENLTGAALYLKLKDNMHTPNAANVADGAANASNGTMNAANVTDEAANASDATMNADNSADMNGNMAGTQQDIQN